MSPEGEPKGRRAADEQGLAKRSEEILTVATQVFAERGFAQADVQEIADRVGIGKGTVYRQFGNKEALFAATAERARQWLIHEIDMAADQAPPSLERLRRGMHAFIAFFDAHPEVVELLIQERAHFRGTKKPTLFEPSEDHMNRWSELFRALIRDGVIRDLPIEQIEQAITNFLFGAMFVNYFAGRQKPLAQQCDEIVDVLFHGLLAPEQCS